MISDDNIVSSAAHRCVQAKHSGRRHKQGSLGFKRRAGYVYYFPYSDAGNATANLRHGPGLPRPIVRCECQLVDSVRVAPVMGTRVPPTALTSPDEARARQFRSAPQNGAKLAKLELLTAGPTMPMTVDSPTLVRRYPSGRRVSLTSLKPPLFACAWNHSIPPARLWSRRKTTLRPTNPCCHEPQPSVATRWPGCQGQVSFLWPNKSSRHVGLPRPFPQ